MLVRQGNGILVEMGGRRFRFDPGRLVKDEVCMVSHAHSDHLPSGLKHPHALCSDITRDFIGLRKGKPVQTYTDAQVTMLDAGHIPGSTMFLVDGERRVLYTGDFCTRDRETAKGAKPVKCDVMIMEATYGEPRYVFPDHAEVMSAAKEWLEELLGHGRSAVLLAYPLGKSQELAAGFRDLPLLLHPTIAENNRLLNRYGYDLAVGEFTGPRHEPFVYITSGINADKARVGPMIEQGARTAAFTGWALDGGFISRSGSFHAFPVSDHCGFDELLAFVKACSPEKVYTTHGFAAELAAHIRKELGIDAQPLVKRQGTIDQFC
jgi:putative mRNA 3-end processing factor